MTRVFGVGMRRALLALHLGASLIAGIFLVILGMTGALLSFDLEIRRAQDVERLLSVEPRGKPLPLVELTSAVLRAFPGDRVLRFDLPTAPNRSYRVALRDNRLQYVDPYSGDVLGPPSPPTTAERFMNTVTNLHIQLLRERNVGLGAAPRWAAVALIVLLVTGTYLWWPSKRVTIQWRGSSTRRWFDVHNAFGALSLAFLLALSVTGTAIAWREHTEPLLYRLTGTNAAPEAAVDDAPAPDDHVQPITPDRALQIARRALPDATPAQIDMPARRRLHTVRMVFPDERTFRMWPPILSGVDRPKSFVTVDRYSGQVVMVESGRHLSLGQRANNLIRRIHEGTVFGLASQIVMSIASLTIVVQLTSGLCLWLKGQRRWAHPMD